MNEKGDGSYHGFGYLSLFSIVAHVVCKNKKDPVTDCLQY